MESNRIDPAKVTKPIQLLAAWLLGLILVNGSFLAAALQIKSPDWAAGALVVAAVVNVPIFIVALFLLQTKFRPEMQEDEYYARHLERRWSAQTATTEIVSVSVKGKSQEIPIRPAIKAQPADDFYDFEDFMTPQKPILRINDLIPKYDYINKVLTEEGFNIGDPFGSTSQGANPPDPLIISFHPLTEMDYLRRAINITLDSGLLGVEIANEIYNSRTVFIGSYSYEKSKYFRAIDADFLNFINNAGTDVSDVVKEIQKDKRRFA